MSHYLQAMDDLSQGQSALITADVSGFGQPEYFVQMGLIQAVEACWDDRKSVIKRAQASRSMGGRERERGGLGDRRSVSLSLCSPRSVHILLEVPNPSSHFRHRDLPPWRASLAPSLIVSTRALVFQQPCLCLALWHLVLRCLCSVPLITRVYSRFPNRLRLYRPLFSVSQDQAFHF